MTRKIAPLAATLLLAFGCSRAGKVQRNQQEYQTVQEGSASGVTSTINAPGETTPPLTNTNVDTTTNFTLPTNPNPLGNDTAGSMASTLPSTTSYPGAPPPSRPRPVTRTPNAPVVTDTIGSTTPPMPKERPAPPREQTDTVAPTDTATTAAPTDTTDTKKDGDQQQPPPPPPPTDTRG